MDYTDKIEGLANARANKLANLTGLDLTQTKQQSNTNIIPGIPVYQEPVAGANEWQTAMLESMTDADSPQFVGVTGGIGGVDKTTGNQYDLTGKLTEDRLQGFDAYEVPHPGDTYKDSESGKRKFDRQRASLAAELNVPVEQVTDDMIYRKGTEQALMALYHMAPGEKDPNWTPGPLDYVTAETPMFLGSKELPLNIQVDRKASGEYGYFGRPLTEIRNIDTQQTLKDALGYRARTPEEVMAAAERAEYEMNKGDISGRLTNAAKGIAFRAGEGIAQTADLIPEVMEYTYKKFQDPNTKWKDVNGLYTDETSAGFQEAIGYDTRYMEEAFNQASDAVKKGIAEGNWWDTAKALGNAVLTPEVAGESIGFIVGMMVPGGILSKGVQATSKGVRVAQAEAKVLNAEARALQSAGKTKEAAEKMKQATDVVVKAEDEAGYIYKTMKTGAQEAGYINYAEQVAREAEKEYMEMYGEEMPTERRMGALALGFASGKMDAIMGKAILTGKDPVALAMRKALMNAPDGLKNEVVGKIAKAVGIPAGRILGAMTEEAVTEGIQSGLETAAGQLKIGDERGSIGAILSDPENLAKIGGEAILGATGGGQMAAPSAARDVAGAGIGLVGEGVSKTTEAIKDYVEKRELGKVEKETTEASKAYEEAVVSSEDLFNEYMKVGTQYLKEQEAGNVSEATEKAARDIAAKMAASEYIGTDDAEQIYQAMKNSSLDETNSDLNSEEPEKIQTVTNNPEKYFGSSQKDLDVVKMRDWITNSVSKGILSENDAKSVMDKLGIDEDIKDTVVLEASKLKQAKQELNKKSMSDVAEEVSTGSRGFVTYFDGAMKGLKINNDKLVQSGMDNLNRLHQLQGQKIGIIDESIQMVKDEINSRLAMVSDRNTGLKNLMRSDIERSPETIGLGYKVKIKLGTIAEQMYNEENGIDKSVGGIYDLRRQVQKEYDAMTVMKDYLNSRVSVKVEEKPVTKTTEKKDSVYTEIDKAIANGWTAEELKATNEKVVSSIKDEKTREKKLIELNDYVDLKMSQPEQEVVTEYKPEANEIVEQAETKQEFDTITNKDEFIGMVSKLPISEDVLAKVKELMKDCE